MCGFIGFSYSFCLCHKTLSALEFRWCCCCCFSFNPRFTFPILEQKSRIVFQCNRHFTSTFVILIVSTNSRQGLFIEINMAKYIRCVCVWVWAHHSFEFTKLTIIHSINQVTCVYLVKSKNLDLCAMSYTRNESKTFQFNWKCFCMCWPVDSVCDDVYMQFWKTVYAMNSLICTSTSLTRVWHIFLLPLSFWFVLTLAIAFLSASRNLMKMQWISQHDEVSF